MIINRIFLSFFLCAVSYFQLSAQNQYTISGYITDDYNGESLIGANIYTLLNNGKKVGAVSNTYGFYSLKLEEGVYDIYYSYIGFGTIAKKVQLTSDQKINVSLIEGKLLEEIVVTGERKDENIKSTDLGKVELGIESIKSIPALMGEVDVIKALQLLPGVQAAGEGNSGIYVRGGGPDQNLILLDNAVVYNPGHLFGFFSVFNADAIKDVTLIKGGMPANYGGRISSVIDVTMKEGNNKKFEMEGGIGLISSRFTLQAPIQKGKGSFLIGGRRTYAFDIAQPLIKKTDFGGTNYNFYDLNLKANYTFSDKDRLFLSGYFGQDIFKYSNKINEIGLRMPWGNATSTLRWNHLFNSKLFMNTSFIFNDYKFMFDGHQLDFAFKIKSGVRDYNLKFNLEHYASNKHQLKYGLDYTYHIFTPNVGTAQTGDTKFKLSEGMKYAHELAGYITDDWDISERFKITTGFRLSMFQQVGPYNFKPDGVYGKDTIVYKKGKAVKTWWGPEPRISMRYAIDGEQSLKAGFAMNYQYVHLVSSTNSTLPTDLWIPSSILVEPQQGFQYNLGYFRNFKDNDYEFSAELYYKNMKNQIEYADDRIQIPNEEVERGYVFGKGWSYGMELFAKKSRGKFNGWLGYTLSYTWRKFPDLNGGKKFPARYDRRHDISINLNYEINDKLFLGGTWVYATGNAYTLPIEKYLVDFVLVTGYGDRNAYRIPAYHRMDVSLTYRPNKKPEKRFKSEYNLSIYNLYSRKNTYFIYYKEDGDLLKGNFSTKAVSVSLFPIIPSFTWNFKF